MRLVAPVPMTGRYALQAKQMAAGLKLWAHRSGASLVLAGEGPGPPAHASRAERAMRAFEAFGGGYDGPHADVDAEGE
jgi:hypothetical protein